MLTKEKSRPIFFAEEQFVLDADGVIYWPGQKTLMVSDLHLEKGSYFAARDQLIPIYDTAHTLENLSRLIKLYQPERLICLGDNFHDSDALSRMLPTDQDYLRALYHNVSEWIWVVGNHDNKSDLKNAPTFVNFKKSFKIEDIYFTHEFNQHEKFQIGGHFHPKVSLKVNNHPLGGKCCVIGSDKIIMPAFGSYTGGLNIKDPVFAKVLKTKFRCFLCRDNAVWRVK